MITYRYAVISAAITVGLLSAAASEELGQTDLRQITAVYVPTDAAKGELAAAKSLAKYLGSAFGVKVAVNPKERPYSPGAQ